VLFIATRDEPALDRSAEQKRRLLKAVAEIKA